MKKIFTLLSVLSLTTLSYSQVSLTSLNTAYTQNFDGLANSGTSSTTLNGTLAGWYILETGSNSNTTYTVGTGSATAGDTYSFGATSSTERALGSIASSNLLSKYGAQFKNDTGNIIDQLESRLIRASKQRHDTQIQQIRNIHQKFFPNNGLQERVDNFLPYYLKYGEKYFELLFEFLHPLNTEFLILEEDI